MAFGVLVEGNEDDIDDDEEDEALEEGEALFGKASSPLERSREGQPSINVKSSGRGLNTREAM